MKLAPLARALGERLRERLEAPAAGTDPSPAAGTAGPAARDADYARVLEALAHDPVPLDELATRTGFGVPALSSMLLLLNSTAPSPVSAEGATNDDTRARQTEPTALSFRLAGQHRAACVHDEKKRTPICASAHAIDPAVAGLPAACAKDAPPVMAKTCSSSNRRPRPRRSTSTSARTSPSWPPTAMCAISCPRRARSIPTRSSRCSTPSSTRTKNTSMRSPRPRRRPKPSTSRPTWTAKAKQSAGIGEILRERGLLKGGTCTASCSRKSRRKRSRTVDHPRELSLDLVNAQQARPRTRLPRRLQPVAGALAQGPRGLSPDACNHPLPHDRRARGRNRSVQAA